MPNNLADEAGEMVKKLRAQHTAYERIGDLRKLHNEAADLIERLAPRFQRKPRELILCEGKYRFVERNEVLYCDRNDEIWRDFTGDKAIFALFEHALMLTPLPPQKGST